MRLIVLALLTTGVLLSGCLKKTDGCPNSIRVSNAPSSEEQMVLSFLTANNISASKHASNLYYEIVYQGTGATPGLCSAITVQYSGSLANGTVFDSQAEAGFNLGALIDGWKWGLPLIQSGGRIKLYIPPSLGYRPTDVKDQAGNVIIPGNSILIFDITLKNVQ